MIGDIIFVHGKGPISDAIEHLDKGPFSHVCIEMPHDCIFESQYVVNTRIMPNPYKESETTIVHLNLTKVQQDKIVYAAFKYLPYKYDIKQIEGDFLDDVFHLHTDWNDPNKLICSEAAIDLLTDGAFFNASEHEKLKSYTPNELYDYLKGAI